MERKQKPILISELQKFFTNMGKREGGGGGQPEEVIRRTCRRKISCSNEYLAQDLWAPTENLCPRFRFRAIQILGTFELKASYWTPILSTNTSCPGSLKVTSNRGFNVLLTIGLRFESGIDVIFNSSLPGMRIHFGSTFVLYSLANWIIFIVC